MNRSQGESRKGGSMAESFETYRPYLFAIAYRMLGSAMDAEDMVQETYLRSQGTPLDTIRSLKAFLTTIIIRLCVDQLQTEGVELSCFLVVSDYARALAFYRDVLGATVVRELPGTLGFLNFRGSQILLSAPGGPTKDQPADGGNLAIGELTMRVPDCSTAYEVLRSRGAEFITPPFDVSDETRAFFHDPDGHLLEIREVREAEVRSE